jgi:hypothetical protein
VGFNFGRAETRVYMCKGQRQVKEEKKLRRMLHGYVHTHITHWQVHKIYRINIEEWLNHAYLKYVLYISQ